MQCLHDETRTAFNDLVEELSSPYAAAQVGAAAPSGLTGTTVQALIKELAEAIGALGGSVEVEGSALADYVAEAVKNDVLGGYYSGSQVEEKLAALGVEALEGRIADMEGAFAQEGLMLGEVVKEYPFTMPAAEMAGAETYITPSAGSAAFVGEELLGLSMGEDGMLLSKVNGAEGKLSSLPLLGDPPPFSAASRSFTLLWTDKEQEYLILRIGSAWYLLSRATAACSLLASGSDRAFCGAARVGNIITAVFAAGGSVYFYRRSIAGDSGSAPAITALDSYYEAGSGSDRVLNVCGGVFVMLKYDAADSKLKVYEPSEMVCSAEFSTGMAGAWAAGGIRISGEDCRFLLYKDGAYRMARCFLDCSGDFAAPTLTEGDEMPANCRIIAETEAGLYAAADSALYLLNGETMRVLKESELPGAVPADFCRTDGATIGGLWGGRYIPAGGMLVDPEDMSARALRCGSGKPAGYGTAPVSGRYFAAFYGGAWHLFDCLLRPVWGMVPYVTAEVPEDENEPEADTSAFGAMSKV